MLPRNYTDYNIEKITRKTLSYKILRLVHILKINFPFPVKLRFPSNLDKYMSKCCSQIWCKKYYGVFCYHEIIMSIIYCRLCRQTLIDRQSRHSSAQIDCRSVRIYTCFRVSVKAGTPPGTPGTHPEHPEPHPEHPEPYPEHPEPHPEHPEPYPEHPEPTRNPTRNTLEYKL